MLRNSLLTVLTFKIMLLYDMHDERTGFRLLSPWLKKVCVTVRSWSSPATTLYQLLTLLTNIKGRPVPGVFALETLRQDLQFLVTTRLQHPR